MENKGSRWKGMTYRELSEYKDNLLKIWERTQPEMTGEDWDRMQQMWGLVDDLWAKANPEEAAEEERSLEEWMEESDRLSYADLEG